MIFLSVCIVIASYVILVDPSNSSYWDPSSDILSQIENSQELPLDTIKIISKYENLDISIYKRFDRQEKIFYFKSPKKNYLYDSIVNNGYIRINEHTLREFDTLFMASRVDRVKSKNNVDYTVIIEKFYREESTYILLLVIALFLLSSTGILLSTLIGSKLSKRMLRPIKNMTETVNDISVNHLSTRLDINKSHDELRELSITFNNMLDRLERDYEKQNQFVSDASHELRTPISVIQGYASLLDRWGKDDKEVLDESIDALRSESQNMKDLVEQLLFLARSDKGTQVVNKSLFSLSELCEEIVKETKLIDKDHDILLENNNNISLYGDRKLIKQAVRIFVDNSIKFTQNKGYIKVQLYKENKNTVLAIEDNGIGIPKEDIPHIFDRFYRSDKSRTKETGGTGLGLSICRWILNEHYATIRVYSVVDIGTKILIYFPEK
ncbi:HAMP domain-containing sensor histidine kinase [Anaeromicrobium sediminis]|uniref:HAMP domain-containing sensor histidine kinase n=1 Tax=Anaeromicrobium sediminis TaxID=1478221 RepID=UPI0015958141|nr:ATP-binding protein [Anaeromicrobium sediminis]